MSISYLLSPCSTSHRTPHQVRVRPPHDAEMAPCSTRVNSIVRWQHHDISWVRAERSRVLGVRDTRPIASIPVPAAPRVAPHETTAPLLHHPYFPHGDTCLLHSPPSEKKAGKYAQSTQECSFHSVAFASVVLRCTSTQNKRVENTISKVC